MCAPAMRLTSEVTPPALKKRSPPCWQSHEQQFDLRNKETCSGAFATHSACAQSDQTITHRLRRAFLDPHTAYSYAQSDMNILSLIPVVLLLAACTKTTATRHVSLTAEQATILARKLANERAKSLYKCEPFHNGSEVRLVEGHWLWRCREAQGRADIEALVELKADGTEPRIEVTLLDSQSTRDF